LEFKDIQTSTTTIQMPAPCLSVCSAISNGKKRKKNINKPKQTKKKQTEINNKTKANNINKQTNKHKHQHIQNKQ